ncbi:putative N-acetyltransferase YjaB [Halomonas sp. THAF5a]|uniref:GNAT family N-acetyltransferase n=1 Tax=Halomonas sp. THAF5a TaxID=2587844 RepID=UPI001268F250|nr:GNAT family N-acetyltransferase [Halomonas sp. THAF5a]QFU02896.1 putative N-acetyltransferase YjaB [Halomonas sp. THAF5a]
MYVESVEKEDYRELLEVWEASVRATHDFLREDDLLELKPLIYEKYFGALDLTCVKGEGGDILGFCGVQGGKIEMLFVAPQARGAGIGSLLLDDAVTAQDASRVDVNEQNPQALGFYRHKGFSVTDRSALDGLGKPYPLLHMALVNTP